MHEDGQDRHMHGPGGEGAEQNSVTNRLPKTEIFGSNTEAGDVKAGFVLGRINAIRRPLSQATQRSD
jgi:hypothetical protein